MTTCIIIPDIVTLPGNTKKTYFSHNKPFSANDTEATLKGQMSSVWFWMAEENAI